MSMPERPKRRMLLVASLGVATVSYALAACEKQQVGNLAMPPEKPTAESPVSGNLTAPPSPADAGAPPPPASSLPPDDMNPKHSPTGGNLMPPPQHSAPKK